MAITFTAEDEPKARSVRAPVALVLNPIVDGFWLTKVLMDDGSGLYLIYEDMLDKMQMDVSCINNKISPFDVLSPVEKHDAWGKLNWM